MESHKSCSSIFFYDRIYSAIIPSWNIPNKDVPISDGNYTEVEVKILGIIATLSKEDAMSAAEISAAVGCNIQKVAIWGSKVLAKKGLINIEKREARNYYYDKVD